MTLKDVIRLVTPPIVIHLANRLRRNKNQQADPYGLSGNYRSWKEATAASIGYDSETILEKTRTALLKVKNGEAVYERDSVLFDEIEYTWPVLAGLMWVAARSGGKLNVLDFGGSLGSTYFQNRFFLSKLYEVRWNIIEQPSHVKAGKTYFEDDILRFYESVEECLADTDLNVVLFSGVLQYLEHPYSILDQVLGLSCNYVIIDRTPFWSGPIDRLCVQTVPPSVYPGSYPSWIFSEPKFHDYIKEQLQVVSQFESLDILSAPVETVSLGFILERRKIHDL